MVKIKLVFNINVYLIGRTVENECDKGQKVILPCGHTTISALNFKRSVNIFSLDTQYYLM